VAAKWVQDLLGEAFVTVIVKNGKDITTVAHIGRHIRAELRTAMIASGRECSIEGCTGRDYLELDHCEVDFAEDGPHRLVEPRLVVLDPSPAKNPGLATRPARPVTGTRPLDPPGASRAA